MPSESERAYGRWRAARQTPLGGLLDGTARYGWRRNDGAAVDGNGDLKQDQILRSMRLFAEEVMPAFQDG